MRMFLSCAILGIGLWMTPQAAVNPRSIDGGEECTGTKKKVWCSGVVCFYYVWEYQTTTDTAKKKSTAAATRTGCEDIAACDEYDYIPSVTGCDPPIGAVEVEVARVP